MKCNDGMSVGICQSDGNGKRLSERNDAWIESKTKSRQELANRQTPFQMLDEGNIMLQAKGWSSYDRQQDLHEGWSVGAMEDDEAADRAEVLSPLLSSLNTII